MVPEDHIFQCWIATGEQRLAEYVSDNQVGVARWMLDALDRATPRSEIHVVCYRADEYGNN